MSYIHRLLNLEVELKSKSLLLVGARQTGKSSLIRETLPRAKKYNLLESDTYLQLQRNPALIRQQLRPDTKLIVIDEIQKIPELLDEVHLLIEEYKIRFLLTGSSLRRFSQRGINRLGGRLRTKKLFPFCSTELQDPDLNLKSILETGLIPAIYTSETPLLDLKDYVADYVQGEIVVEGAIRNIPAFSRFLEVAALTNGEMINYTNIANDAQVARTTVIDYFKVLTHTLIGYELPAWKESKKRKPISTSKYYFFDTGIVNTILERKTVSLKSAEAGSLFETFIYHELQCFKSYKKDFDICYWRSTSGYEVDFVFDSIALEVKMTSRVTNDHLKGLMALKEENIIKDFYLICQEPEPRTVSGVKILHWRLFLEQLWAGNIL